VKKFLLASVALLLFPFTAQAADIAEQLPPDLTWQGFYLGAHVGHGWGTEMDNQSEFFQDGPQPADEFNIGGFIGGIHAGYNWQMDTLVFGVEGDIDGSNIKGDTDFDYGFYSGNLSFKSDLQGSARLRAGYAMDRALIYATGGVAFARGELTEDGGPDDHYRDEQTHIGWTLGAGIEYAFTSNWIGRLEGRYTDFGSKAYNMSEPGLSDYIYDVDLTQTVLSVGVSYKF
jgi:outer membrane immunogenic protein